MLASKEGKVRSGKKQGSRSLGWVGKRQGLQESKASGGLTCLLNPTRLIVCSIVKSSGAKIPTCPLPNNGTLDWP